MLLLRSGILAVWCIWTALMLIGCEGSSLNLNVAQADPPEDVFDALPMPVTPGTPVEIKNDISGTIQISAYPANEVALDYTTTGWGATSEDQALVEAHRQIAVTEFRENGRLKIWVRSAHPDMNSQDSVLVHVRVPQETNLDLTTTRGDVIVSGDVHKVQAFTQAGNIAVRGATGPQMLTTNSGEIVVDERNTNEQHLELHASSNITITGVNSSVVASSQGGNIRFIGTLIGANNSFETLVGGNIMVALPEDMPYSFQANGGTRVINDFRPVKQTNTQQSRAICGMIDAGSQYNYQVNHTDDIFGRVEVSSTITNTYVSGLMATDYYLFRTNRNILTFFAPRSHSLHIDVTEVNNAAYGQAGSTDAVGACREIPPNPPQPSVRFTLRADTGRIYIHHIKMHNFMSEDP